MRQLTVLPREQAQLLADHLLTLQIETRLDEETAGSTLWVHDEDRLEQAREELAAFVLNPTDARYQSASAQARAIRAKEQQADVNYERRQRSFAGRMRDPNSATTGGLVTILLAIASIAVSLATNFGQKRESPILRACWMVRPTPDGKRWFPDEGLRVITHEGEVWRLVTPIFVHLDGMHLLFNMLALISLGGPIERRIGSGAFLGMVFLIAVPSNLAQYFFQFGLNVPGGFSFDPTPLFGGMSGVIYGLFGFLWVRSWKAEIPEAVLSQQSVFIMLMWLVLCMTGAVGPIANTAHVVGLLIGMAIAWLANRYGE